MRQVTESEKSAIATAKDAAEKAADLMRPIMNSSMWDAVVDAQKTLQQLGDSINRFTDVETYVYPLPDVTLLPVSSLEEQSEYESAAALIDRLERRMNLWLQNIPDDAQPVMLATIPQMGAIRVTSLIADGHNGVVVIGTADGNEFMFLTHQANLQLVCYVEKVEEETKRVPIGFLR